MSDVLEGPRNWIVFESRTRIWWKRLPRYTAWWLKVWFKQLICGHPSAHNWTWDTCVCRRCGLTMEEAEDHTWSFRPPRVGVWIKR